MFLYNFCSALGLSVGVTVKATASVEKTKLTASDSCG